MTTSVTDASSVAGVIGLVGFAIQRGLQILDPLVDASLKWLRTRYGGNPGATYDPSVDVGRKRTLTAALAFLFGWLAASAFNIRLVECVLSDPKGNGVSHHTIDMVITALVLSAGCDGANSALKYLEAAKNARKPATAA